jgi:AraC-like DNA-binding protein
MKAVEYRLPQDLDKSFIVFQEKATFFPCPWHYHPEYEIVLVNKSFGRRMVGDHIGYFEEGEIALIGPMLAHVWVNDPHYLSGKADGLADATVIHFLDDFLGKNLAKVPEMESLKDVLNLSNRGLVINGDARKKIAEVMSSMLDASGLVRLSGLFMIFDILANTKEYSILASPGYAEHTQLNTTDRFDKINTYIINNFDREISLPEIASIANMGITTFCNFFKKHYRVTFIEYVNSIRIGYACRFLSDKNKNVAEIAYSCGFRNLVNFNRQFKKFKNMTPSEFRKDITVEV